MKSLHVVFLVAGVVLAIGIVTYLNRAKEPRGQLVSAVKRSRQPVRIEVIRPRPLEEQVTHTGTLAAVRDVTLSAEVPAKVLRKLKDLGDRCRQGEVLLQLDPESYRLALLQAEAALRQARVQEEQARREHRRTAALARQAAISHQSVERTETAVHTGAAAVKQAEVAVQLARRNLRETSIRCPFAGTVADTLVEQGQAVGPQLPLARIVDTATLKLRLNVSAHELGRLAVGMPVTLVDFTRSERSFAGKVSRIGVAGDSTTHAFPVEVEVPGGGGGPSPGQVVQATITTATHTRALAVPGDALVEGALFVVREGKARRIPVSAGPRVGSRVLIAGGLTAGAEVIVVGTQGLQDGDPVEVVGRSTAEPDSGERPAPAPPPAQRPTSAATPPPASRPTAPAPAGR